MPPKIQLLDCTLRDGCYIVDSFFGAAAIRGLIEKLSDARVDIIECGWLKNNIHEEGSAFYHVPSDLLNYINHKDPNKIYVAMIDWDRYDLSYLPPCDNKSFDAIRVVFPHGRYREGIEVGRKIKEKGYHVYFQAANTLSYDDDELIELANAMSMFVPESLSIVDTFGAMYEEDLEHIVHILDDHLTTSIKLGFHSHNNQQLSFSLTQHFIRLLANSNRDFIVDSSLCGMGRGAGNTPTELAASYLNRTQKCHYDLDAVMDAIDTYMVYFKERFKWGYNTSYFIAGLYCCHVNNIAYLLDRHRISARDMRHIIESLSPNDRLKYDYELLESKYLENQSRYVDDTKACEKLKAEFKNKSIILIAPGRQSIECKHAITNYICKNNCLVVAVNAILNEYDYDYAFFVNPSRYDYASKAHPQKFLSTKRIILSNINGNDTNNEYVIAYDHAIKSGWKYFDNAVICCLRLMDYLGVEKVSIAGFDGFKEIYNESYADPMLPSLNTSGNWSALNEEIKAMFKAFKAESKSCKEIIFLTESCFNDKGVLET